MISFRKDSSGWNGSFLNQRMNEGKFPTDEGGYLRFHSSSFRVYTIRKVIKISPDAIKL